MTDEKAPDSARRPTRAQTVALWTMAVLGTALAVTAAALLVVTGAPRRWWVLIGISAGLATVVYVILAYLSAAGRPSPPVKPEPDRAETARRNTGAEPGAAEKQNGPSPPLAEGCPTERAARPPKGFGGVATVRDVPISDVQQFFVAMQARAMARQEAVEDELPDARRRVSEAEKEEKRLSQQSNDAAVDDIEKRRQNVLKDRAAAEVIDARAEVERLENQSAKAKADQQWAKETRDRLQAMGGDDQ
ncbi:hypothetical protein OHA21_26390 [Actinoplanes sp. NBC_00393]|uniref:hypothetical protein n=1 Tax=Actinoplanes sp. NBC_00393 TaxID=2975953 RepID=UPI002E1F36CD